MFATFSAERQFVTEYLEKKYASAMKRLFNGEKFDQLLAESVAAKAPLAQALGLGPDLRISVTSGTKTVPACYLLPLSALLGRDFVDDAGKTLEEVILSNSITIKQDGKDRTYRFTRWLSKSDSMIKSFAAVNEGRDLPTFITNMNDALSKANNLRHVISVNPFDILFSSEHAGYESCHGLGPHQAHSNGNNAYLRDGQTFIVYATRDGEGAKGVPFKHGRSLSFMGKNLDDFILGRIYGNLSRTALFDVGVFLAERLDTLAGREPTPWSTEGPGVEINPSLFTYGGARFSSPRPFYLDQSALYHFSKNKAAENPKIVVNFEQARCLRCGELNNVSSGWCCEPCLSKLSCSSCGSKDDALNEIDGKSYCSGCVDRYFKPCAQCGTRNNRDDMLPTRGDFVCQPCYQANYRVCPTCTEVAPRAERVKTRAGRVCCASCIEYVQQREDRMSVPARNSVDAIISELMHKYDAAESISQVDVDDLLEAILIKRFKLTPIAVFELNGEEVTRNDLAAVFPALSDAAAQPAVEV